jgi:predicted amidohydrolase
MRTREHSNLDYEGIIVTILGLVQTVMTTSREKNIQNALDLMQQAAKQNVDIICFPEISFYSFFPQFSCDPKYFKIAEPIPGPVVEFFQKAAEELSMVTVINLYEYAGPGEYYDTSPVIEADGTLLGKVRMTHTCEEKHFHEKFYYWEPRQHTCYQVFPTSAGKIGVAICYDRHFPEVMRALAVRGAELILTPTAVTQQEPFEMYEIEMQAAAFDSQVYTTFCNRIGQETALEFGGGSFIVHPSGTILARASKTKQELLVADLGNMEDVIANIRTNRHYLRDRRPETYWVLTDPEA